VRVPDDAALLPGVTIRARAQWVVCESVCLFGGEELELTLPVARSAEPSPDEPRIRSALADVPRPITRARDSSTAELVGRRLTLRSPGAASIAFFPGPDCSAPVDPVAGTRRDADVLGLDLEPDEDGQVRASGVLEATDPAGTRRVHWVELPDPDLAIDPDRAVAGRP
jgi:DsbC/DsbD-like thiol-disulfide interchange protein